MNTGNSWKSARPKGNRSVQELVNELSAMQDEYDANERIFTPYERQVYAASLKNKKREYQDTIRAALDETHARLVDGPTATGAFLLHVAETDRDRILASLRGSPRVILAEPVDSGEQP